MPRAGVVYCATQPIEVLKLESYADEISGEQEFCTRAMVIEANECFLVLTSEEIPEIPQVQLDILYKSEKYFLNVAYDWCMIDVNGEGGQFSFPFEAVKHSTERHVQGGDTRTCLELEI